MYSGAYRWRSSSSRGERRARATGPCRWRSRPRPSSPARRCRSRPGSRPGRVSPGIVVEGPERPLHRVDVSYLVVPVLLPGVGEAPLGVPHEGVALAVGAVFEILICLLRGRGPFTGIDGLEAWRHLLVRHQLALLVALTYANIRFRRLHHPPVLPASPKDTNGFLPNNLLDRPRHRRSQYLPAIPLHQSLALRARMRRHFLFPARAGFRNKLFI